MKRLDPHSYADPTQGSISRLQLKLAVDFERRRLSGEATLHLEGGAAGPLDLDTRELTIEAITASDGTTLSWTQHDSEDWMGARLTIDRPAGVAAVTVRYHTAPTASALQWLEPRHTAGGVHPYMFSQCQPHHARSIVPIQDSPRVRFAYEAEITAPRPLAAVMSAAPGQPRSGPTGDTTTTTFSMPQPIPAYLLALAVGNITSADIGPRTRVYTEPEMLQAAAWEFADAERMLEAAEELFGPYRWQRFDFLVMPPAFPYGGMENPRLTFLTPTLIAGDRSLVNVLAHELAHSWTGNLVTNATMNDFWLNEGFTVWAERRILERLDGADAVSLAAAIGRHGLDEAIERFGAGSDLTRLENDLEGVDPDSIYSVVPYEKGFLFVALLERTLGREAFDVFVKEYLDHFGFTSITTAEFERYVEQTRPGLLAQVHADAWIHGPGIPDNSPSFTSERLVILEDLAAGWSDGVRPDPDQARQWPVEWWQIYLPRLPRPMSAQDCAWLEGQFRFNESRNAEIVCDWLVLAATSAYEPAFERIGEFLGSVGRMKYLKPLYTALLSNDTTRPLALELFARCGDDYHPIARAGLVALLAR